MKTLCFIAISVSILMTGCANLTITKTSNETYTEGVRFFRPHPYLLVTTSEAKIIQLPNTNEEYVAKIKPGFGSIKSTLAITDGWQLTSINIERDPKVAETINALTGALSGIPKVLAAERGLPTLTEKLEPGLYKIYFDKNGYVEKIVKVDIYK